MSLAAGFVGAFAVFMHTNIVAQADIVKAFVASCRTLRADGAKTAPLAIPAGSTAEQRQRDECRIEPTALPRADRCECLVSGELRCAHALRPVDERARRTAPLQRID